jgi:hypothetical protein
VGAGSLILDALPCSTHKLSFSKYIKTREKQWFAYNVYRFDRSWLENASAVPVTSSVAAGRHYKSLIGSPLSSSVSLPSPLALIGGETPVRPTLPVECDSYLQQWQFRPAFRVGF